MAHRPLNEKFAVPGRWFLPEQPERQIAGTLRYAPDHSTLELSDAFRPMRGTLSAGDSAESYPTVYGVTEKGEAATLVNALRMGYSFNLGSGGSQQQERLASTLLLIGAHVPAPLVFPRVSFRVPGLQVWHSKPAIHEGLQKNEGNGDSELTYRITRYAKESIRVSAIDASLEFERRLAWSDDIFSTVNATVSGWITISPSAPQDLPWFIRQSSKITTMLTLLAGVPMAPDCVVGLTDDPLHPVDVMVALLDTKCCTHRNTHEFYLTRPAMGVALDAALATWLEVFPKVHLPSRLAMSILGSDDLFVHVEFLSLMQALEGFHRSLYPGSYMDPSSYEGVKLQLEQAIPDQLSSDHKTALKSRLTYGNEISLRKRLERLAEVIPNELRPTIFGIAGRVPREWIDTRHYYTHWDEALRAQALDAEGMHHANARLRHFLRVLYLLLMGIPKEALVKAVGNGSHISQELIHVLAVERRKQDPNDRTGVLLRITEGPKHGTPSE